MANQNKPTMHEVAKEAKTSIATVSRVINGNHPVSPKLEKRVRKAMAKLHYHPSTLARSFKKQETMLIGVLIPLLEHPGYSRMAAAIEKTLFDRGYRGLICNSQEDEARETAYIESLMRQRVDGIIINSSARDPQYLADLQSNNIPIVLFDRSIKGLSCDQVYCDNAQGGYAAIQHLASLGHRRIGVIAAPVYPEPIAIRLAGTRQALNDYGCDDDPALVVTGNNQLFDMGYESARYLLSLPHPPTAIFSLTDVTAVGVMHAAAEMGVRVPDQLSVVGYDDLPIARYMLPTLTTIRQPMSKMGETAVELMIKTIQQPALVPERIILPIELVVRNSTTQLQHNSSYRKDT